MIKNSPLYNYGSALLALLIWGYWAYLVNFNTGSSAGITSGITQGVVSFFMTLIVAQVVTVLYNYIQIDAWKMWLPALTVTAVISIMLFFVHTIVGTSNILMTIGPSLSVTFGFCLFTSYKLNKISIEISNND